MRLPANKTLYKKIALVLSLCTIVLWSVLGTGASLAWFVDATPEMNNIFHFADFKLTVSHYVQEEKDWEKVEANTKIFDENALYEPGYVQVIYLKIDNEGSVPFNFYTAVNVNDCVAATNVYDEELLLQDHLKFGVITDITETDIINGTLERDIAKENANILLRDIANMPLSNYATDPALLQPSSSAFIALIVRMPEDVGNVANYRGDKVPMVELGITVKAEQLKN